jgi:hypothetical protein
MLRGMRWILVAVLLTACRSNPPGKPGVDPSVVACQTNDDCVLVEMECCDSCNGGVAWSVNANHAEAARSRHGTTCKDEEIARCATAECPAEPTPVCDNNVCATLRDDAVSHNVVDF